MTRTTICVTRISSPSRASMGCGIRRPGRSTLARAYATADLNRPRADLPQPYYSLHRIWRGNMLLKPSANLDPYEPTKEYPLFLQPDRKLTPADLLAVFKDYYAGTELDEYGAQDAAYPTLVDPVTGHYRLAPVWCRSRIIGCPQAVTTWVTQSRDWLPDPIGGLLWGGLAAGATSPHIPWYACNLAHAPGVPDRRRGRQQRLPAGLGLLALREHRQPDGPLLSRHR